MPGLQETIGQPLTSRYLASSQRISELAAPLTEEQFWSKPFPYGNSFGHLVLHLTGNLNYYIGAQLANNGYVRDREREFNEPAPPSKREALERLHEAVVMATATIDQQSSQDWAANYNAVGTNCATRFDILVQCAAHMQHHIGQMIYLVHEWQRKEGSG